MPNVRFVEGTADEFSVTYDTDWPVVPRVGEYLSITVGTGQVMDWKVTRICHVADGDEKLIGTLAWIERA
ncbi:hypothetical protein AAG596_12790 [Citromicrobium bathyomarinum]|uniref:hypothetical protein n=1 Tax=Citromicrobium bathyomarinum TaxID=72174 RepID=UPI003159B095